MNRSKTIALCLVLFSLTILVGFGKDSYLFDAGQVISGTFDGARIPDIDAAKVVSGTLDAARIPDLDAAKVTTGTFDTSRMPATSADASTFVDTATVTWDTSEVGVIKANAAEGGGPAVDLGDYAPLFVVNAPSLVDEIRGVPLYQRDYTYYWGGGYYSIAGNQNGIYKFIKSDSTERGTGFFNIVEEIYGEKVHKFGAAYSMTLGAHNFYERTDDLTAPPWSTLGTGSLTKTDETVNGMPVFKLDHGAAVTAGTLRHRQIVTVSDGSEYVVGILARNSGSAAQRGSTSQTDLLAQPNMFLSTPAGNITFPISAEWQLVSTKVTASASGNAAIGFGSNKVSTTDGVIYVCMPRASHYASVGGAAFNEDTFPFVPMSDEQSPRDATYDRGFYSYMDWTANGTVDIREGSISFWTYLPSGQLASGLAYGPMLSVYGDGGSRLVEIRVSSSIPPKVEVKWGSTTLITSSANLTADTWHHVALAYDMDAPSWTLWMDGAIVGTNTSASVSHAELAEFIRLGGDPNDVSAPQVVQYLYQGLYIFDAPLDQAAVDYLVSTDDAYHPETAGELRVQPFYQMAESMTNSWSAAEGTGNSNHAAFHLEDEDGEISFKGKLESGTLNTPAFRLPYYPAHNRRVIVESNGSTGILEIRFNGDVVPVSGDNTGFDLTGVSIPQDGAR